MKRITKIALAMAMFSATAIAPAAAVTTPTPNGFGCAVASTCQINKNISSGQMGTKWDNSHITPEMTPENAENDTSTPQNSRIHWTWSSSKDFNKSDRSIVQLGSWNPFNGFYNPDIYYRCKNVSGTNKINITFGVGEVIDGYAAREYRNIVGVCNNKVNHITAAKAWAYPLEMIAPGYNGNNFDNHPFIRVEVQKGGVDSANELTIAESSPFGYAKIASQ